MPGCWTQKRERAGTTVRRCRRMPRLEYLRHLQGLVLQIGSHTRGTAGRHCNVYEAQTGNRQVPRNGKVGRPDVTTGYRASSTFNHSHSAQNVHSYI